MPDQLEKMLDTFRAQKQTFITHRLKSPHHKRSNYFCSFLVEWSPRFRESETKTFTTMKPIHCRSFFIGTTRLNGQRTSCSNSLAVVSDLHRNVYPMRQDHTWATTQSRIALIVIKIKVYFLPIPPWLVSSLFVPRM